MNQWAAIVFPILPVFVDRLLVEKRKVFVKYIARNGAQIKPKQKVLFYVSRSSKEIVGEGQIVEIEFLTPDEVFAKHGDKVFLKKDELVQYALKQPNRDTSKKMLVLVLTRLKRYPKPVKCKKGMTMAGQYLTEDDYKELMTMMK